jgi:hypothetical protein
MSVKGLGYSLGIFSLTHLVTLLEISEFAIVLLDRQNLAAKKITQVNFDGRRASTM